MSEHLLEVENLSVSFGHGEAAPLAVNGVSWHVDRGETLAILGESGSGKSVSVGAVMDILDTPPARILTGRILLEGVDLLKLGPRQRRAAVGSRLSMVFQDTLAALNPVYSVGWQVGEAFRVRGMSFAESEQRTLELFQRVGIADSAQRVHHFPHEFSGGQRQRVMIAIALAVKPDLLVADEPTSALDVTVQAQILKLLKELQRDLGMGMVFITHDLGIVKQIADRVIVMNRGQVVETGSVVEVLSNPQHDYTRKLLAAVPGQRPLAAPRSNDDREPLLSVRNLSKVYPSRNGAAKQQNGGAIAALDNVSFELFAGETLGIVGESGSGKSTLARTLLGLDEPTSGQAIYRGQVITGRNEKELRSFRRQVQMVFQDPASSLNPRMTIANIIAEPWAAHPDIVHRPRRAERIVELLEQVGLEADHAVRFPHQFSGGQRQRIAIARALALEPDVVVCDEAVSALDVSIQAQVIELLRSLRDALDLSYIFIAHDLPLIRDFADRVIVMSKGRIVEQGTTRDIFTTPTHTFTRELMAASLLLPPNFPQPPSTGSVRIPIQTG